jgi:hypothetical protein
MSTGCECQYIEVKPGEWFYILEDYHAPRNAWDWREYADAYGPFPTREKASEHLHANFGNPGGAWIRKYEEGYQPDEVEAALFDAARKRPKRSW